MKDQITPIALVKAVLAGEIFAVARMMSYADNLYEINSGNLRKIDS